MYDLAVAELVDAAICEVVAGCGRDFRGCRTCPIGDGQGGTVGLPELHGHVPVGRVGDEANGIPAERVRYSAVLVPYLERHQAPCADQRIVAHWSAPSCVTSAVTSSASLSRHA